MLVVGVHHRDLHNIRVGELTRPSSIVLSDEEIPGQPCFVVREATYAEYMVCADTHGWRSTADPKCHKFFEVTTD